MDPTQDQGDPCGGSSPTGGTGSGDTGAAASDLTSSTLPDCTTKPNMLICQTFAGTNLLATVPPAPGAVCGSPVQSLPLGSNLPLGSTGKSTDVVQVWYLYEPSNLNPNPTGNPLQGGQLIVGFIYVTAGSPPNPGQYFVQSTGANPSFVLNLINGVPGIGPALSAIQSSTAGAFSQPLNGTQANAIFGKYPPKGKSNGSGPCFSSPLPPTQWA